MVTAEHFFGVRVAVKTLLAQPARKVSMDMFGCILPVLVVYSYIYIYIYTWLAFVTFAENGLQTQKTPQRCLLQDSLSPRPPENLLHDASSSTMSPP